MYYTRPLFIACLLCALGWGLYMGADKPAALPKPKPRVITPQPDWSAVDQEVRKTLTLARKAAREHGQRSLASWKQETYGRFTRDMEPFLYRYVPMQKLAYVSLWKRVTGGREARDEYLRKTILREFNARVIRPPIAQREIERIAEETSKVYIDTLISRLRTVPGTYQLSRVDWERYTSDLSSLMPDPSGLKDVPLSLKLITTGTGVMTVNALSRVSLAAGGKLAAGPGAMASGLGARLAGTATARLVSCTTGPAGILVTVLITSAWEYADHTRSKQKIRAATRMNVQDYLEAMTRELLDSPRHGVMAGIYQFETGILKKLNASPTPTQAKHGGP